MNDCRIAVSSADGSASRPSLFTDPTRCGHDDAKGASYLREVHADTTEARWVMAQLGVLVPAPSGDTDKKSEPVPNYDRGVAPTGATVDDALDAGLLASFTFRSRPPLILAEGSE